MLGIAEKQKLMEIKEMVAELHNSILSLSQGLWEISLLADDILMSDEQHTQLPNLDEEVGQYGNDEPVEMTHSDRERAEQMYREQLEYESKMEQQPQPEVVRAQRGRPRREPVPEPQRAPVSPPVPDTLPPLPTAPPEPPKAPEQPKQNIVERLLGKDADQKAKLRAERMAQLEKELDALKKK